MVAYWVARARIGDPVAYKRRVRCGVFESAALAG